jgi:selenocysteine-specific elongation factor
VLDPLPPAGKALWPTGLESEIHAVRLEALLARRPRGIAEGQLPLLLGIAPAEVRKVVAKLKLVQAGGVLVAPTLVKELQATVLATVQGWQRAHPAEQGMPVETLRQGLTPHGPAAEAALIRLLHAGTLIAEGSTLREPAFRPAAAGGDAMVARLVERLSAAALAPPTVAELEAELKLRSVADALRLAARSGVVVAVERDRYFTRPALATFVATLRTLGADGPITPAALREATGLSRKFVIPLLEWADGAGLTVRNGEARVPGPRLADWA